MKTLSKIDNGVISHLILCILESRCFLTLISHAHRKQCSWLPFCEKEVRGTDGMRITIFHKVFATGCFITAGSSKWAHPLEELDILYNI